MSEGFSTGEAELAAAVADADRPPTQHLPPADNYLLRCLGAGALFLSFMGSIVWITRGQITLGRIVTAVARIDGDDDIATDVVVLGRPFYRLRPPLTIQVDNQAVAVALVGTGGKTPRAHGLAQIEHNAQLTVCP